MAQAEVGDDVYHEDPTVRQLEEETAAVLGKEASLFVPSGCMGNEVCVASSTRRGDTILLDRFSHLVLHESTAIQEMLGRSFHFLDGERGRLFPEQVAHAKDGEGRISLVAVEQTHNWGSGAIYPLPRLRAIQDAAQDRGIPIHLDGARLWNASAATGISPAEYAACADSVMVCYSKGLGAPVGSAVAGSASMIHAAREARRSFGGGMRQVGIVAAGALHGLRHHRDRLAEDHRRARRLAEAIAEIPGLHVDPREIESNIVIVTIENGVERMPRFVEALAEAHILVAPFGGPGRFRAATHLDVDDTGIDRAIMAMRAAVGATLAR